MKKVIGCVEKETGNIEFHAYIGSEFALCGTAIDGDMFCEVDVPEGQKIKCHQCLLAFVAAKRFKGSDFQSEQKAPGWGE